MHGEEQLMIKKDLFVFNVLLHGKLASCHEPQVRLDMAMTMGKHSGGHSSHYVRRQLRKRKGQSKIKLHASKKSPSLVPPQLPLPKDSLTS